MQPHRTPKTIERQLWVMPHRHLGLNECAAYDCGGCDDVFVTEEAFKIHIRDEHEYEDFGDAVYNCDDVFDVWSVDVTI